MILVSSAVNKVKLSECSVCVPCSVFEMLAFACVSISDFVLKSCTTRLHHPKFNILFGVRTIFPLQKLEIGLCQQKTIIKTFVVFWLVLIKKFKFAAFCCDYPFNTNSNHVTLRIKVIRIAWNVIQMHIF